MHEHKRQFMNDTRDGFFSSYTMEENDTKFGKSGTHKKR